MERYIYCCEKVLFVFNYDRLNLAHMTEEMDTSWVQELSSEQQQISSKKAEMELGEDLNMERGENDFTLHRPHTNVRPLQRFGEWYM